MSQTAGDMSNQLTAEIKDTICNFTAVHQVSCKNESWNRKKCECVRALRQSLHNHDERHVVCHKVDRSTAKQTESDRASKDH